MTQQTNALRLADAEPIQCAEYAIWEQQVRAELRRLDAENNTLHEIIDRRTAKLTAAEAERDQLRAQVERLQGGESVAVIGPPNKQCHTCGFVGPEDVVMGCPKCGFDDMRAIRSTAGFLPDWEFDVHDDDDGLTWLNIYPPHGAVAAFSVQTKRRDGQTTIAAEVLRKFVKAIKAAQLQANSPFCPGCGSTECDQPAAPALVPWQPIETAPKDGTVVILGRIGDGEDVSSVVTTGHWQEAEDDGVDYMGADAGFIDEHYQEFNPGRSFGNPKYMYAPSQPTHWMPLPPAPVGIGRPVGGEGA